jgi:hypothetical protein
MAGLSALNQAKPARKKDVKFNRQVHGHLNNILSKNEILRAIKQVFRTCRVLVMVRAWYVKRCST